MTDSTTSLLDAAGVAPETARTILAEALDGAEDGELFVEERRSEALVFDNGRLKQASFDSGRGLRTARRGGRGGGLRPFVGGLGTGAEARRADRERGRGRARRQPGGRAARHQRPPLPRHRPAGDAGLRREGRASAGDRRLPARARRPGAPGDGLAGRRAAGGGDRSGGRPGRARRAAARPAQRLGRGRGRTPAGDGKLRHRRARRI